MSTSLKSRLKRWANRRLRQPYYRTFGAKTIRSQLSRPIVSFTFDDYPQSAWTVAGRILNDHGVRGTYYTALGLMDQTSRIGQLYTRDDLISTHNAGHEIACHTFSHPNLRRTPVRECVDDVERNLSAFQRLVPNGSLQNFSYPSGSISIGNKRALTPRFDTLRGVEDGINAGVIHLNLLRARRMYDAEGTVETDRTWIDRNAARCGWLIFYTHDVCDDPSDVGCTPRRFEAAVRAALECSAEVLTIAAAYQRLTNNS